MVAESSKEFFEDPDIFSGTYFPGHIPRKFPLPGNLPPFPNGAGHFPLSPQPSVNLQ